MSIVKDGIIGHAIGDAMGVPIEFTPREKLLDNPVTEMLGHGTYDVDAGSFSDDTSMELALIDSYIKKEEFNYDDIMNNFSLMISEGKFTPDDKLFDIGLTCSNAVNNYLKGTPPLEAGLDDYNSNGNGSLMRILPVVYYAYYKKLKQVEILELVKNISSLTHRHEISIIGCYLYVNYVLNIINGKDKYASLSMLKALDLSMFKEENIDKYSKILNGNLKDLHLNDIKSSGYVVDTLEAALWVVLNTDSYSSSIIGAINLGEDTDTIGAVTGSITGILYGYSSIPKSWLNTLRKKEYLEEYCKSFENVLLKNLKLDNYIYEDNRIYKLDDNNNLIAEVTFNKINEDTYNINHTFVDDEYSGKGLGKSIVLETIRYLKSRNINIKSTCTFASKILEEEDV